MQAGRHVLAHPDNAQAHQSFEFATPVLWMRLQNGYLFPKVSPIEEVKPHTEIPQFMVSTEIQAYLAGILTDTQDLENRYIDLSAITTQTEIPAPKKLGWSQDLIPSSFRTVDKHLNPQSSTERILNSINEALEIHSSFILLGDPGSGKTTTLIKLRLDYAKQAQQNPNARIPLYIRLSSDWPEHILDIPSLIQHARQVQGLPPIHFNKLLILLDGLNEIAAQHYVERVKLLDAWLKANLKVSVVISCREKHYLNSKKLSIPTVLVSPFDNERIQLFLNAYLGSDAGRALLPQLGELEVENRSRRDLIHLAHNPYLLSLICYVYASNYEHLPESRGDLFRLFVKTLYKREEDLQATHGIEYQNLLAVFSDIAFAMQQNRSATSVHKAWAEKQVKESLDINALWQLGRDASLLEFAKDEQILHFTHQLILEYFAAEGLLKRYARLSKYISKPVFSHNQRNSGRWDEVVFTLAGIAEPNEFLVKLADCDPFLAVDCFEHIPKNKELTQETLNVIVNRLIQFFESGHLEARVAAAEKVLLLKSVALPELIKTFETSQNPVVKRTCLNALAKIDDYLALKTLILALDDKVKWVRVDAEELLEKIERNNIKKYLSILIHTSTNNKELINSIIRLIEVGCISKDYLSSLSENSTVELILSYIKESEIEEYTKIKNEERKQIISFLKNISLNAKRNTINKLDELDEHTFINFLLHFLEDENPVVRLTTIKALSKIGDNLPFDKLLDLLKDENAAVRIAAIKALSQIDDGLPINKVLPLLEDKNAEVRLTAIKTLSQVSDGLPVDKLLHFLDDGKATVRLAATKALLQLGDSLPINKLSLLLENKNADVRSTAIKHLSKLDNILSADTLLSFLEDESATVRKTAINSLSNLSYDISIDKLLSLLKNKNSDIRVTAIKALSILSDELPTDKLLPFLEDEDSNVKVFTIKALSKSDDILPIDKLLPFLEDKSIEVRIIAITILSQKGDNLLIDKLLPYLNDNIHVAMATVSALAKLSNDIELRKILITRLKKYDMKNKSKAQELLQQLESELPT